MTLPKRSPKPTLDSSLMPIDFHSPISSSRAGVLLLAVACFAFPPLACEDGRDGETDGPEMEGLPSWT